MSENVKNVKSTKEMVLEIKAHIAREEENKDRELLNRLETIYRLYRKNRV